MNRKRKLAAMQRIGDGGGIRITSTPPPTEETEETLLSCAETTEIVDLDLAFNPAEPRDLKGRWRAEKSTSINCSIRKRARVVPYTPRTARSASTHSIVSCGSSSAPT